VGKQNVLLVNKADLLNDMQLAAWRDYFREEGIPAIFWSAIEELAKIDEEEDDKQSGAAEDSPDDADADPDPAESKAHDDASDSEQLDGHEEEDEDEDGWESDDDEADDDEAEDDDGDMLNENDVHAQQAPISNLLLADAPMIDNPEDLITLLKQLGRADLIQGGRPVMVAMVGYPNVGKSSTINRLLGHKKVPVSATPGKTRHLQTLPIDAQLTLCDCPGLVMPSFVFSRDEMLLNGEFGRCFARQSCR
jgi:large subunit GTPase 1